MDGVSLLENSIKMDDLEVPPFKETSYGCHIGPTGGRFFLSSQPIWFAARYPTALKGKSRSCHFGKIIGKNHWDMGK